MVSAVWEGSAARVALLRLGTAIEKGNWSLAVIARHDCCISSRSLVQGIFFLLHGVWARGIGNCLISM